jgi:hypothetical protein
VRALTATLAASLALAGAGSAAAQVADVAASPPTALSATLYRNPYRGAGSISLDDLGGFALITETRTVHLPAGESRLRFEGVVDGIEPASAIVAGLPGGVIEKNRDAALISPEALLRAAQGAEVALVRTGRKTGKVARIPATIRAAGPDGVVFQTAEGIETLKCSGLPETFQFSRIPAGLSATPTLSVLTRTSAPVTATVTLSYLASGFDWAADYVARLDPDGGALDLAGWITLANGNAISLPDAKTQIVAGRLNRVAKTDDDAPSERVIARCWPTGTTSDQVPPPDLQAARPYGFDLTEMVVTARRERAVMYEAAPLALAGAAKASPPEQLGDLKLYRLPEPTTVAANQAKQVSLLERPEVRFARLCIADLWASGEQTAAPAAILLRARNDKAGGLGLPLPSGRVAVFSAGRGLLLGEADLHDTAEGEDVELHLGTSPDVQVTQRRLAYHADAPEIAQLAPQILLALRHGRTVEEVEIDSARAAPTAFELRLQTGGAATVVDADQPMGTKDGRPMFRLTIPAGGRVFVRYVVKD